MIPVIIAIDFWYKYQEQLHYLKYYVSNSQSGMDCEFENVFTHFMLLNDGLVAAYKPKNKLMTFMTYHYASVRMGYLQEKQYPQYNFYLSQFPDINTHALFVNKSKQTAGLFR